MGGVGSLVMNVHEQRLREAGEIVRLGVYTDSKSAWLHFPEITVHNSR